MKGHWENLELSMQLVKVTQYKCALLCFVKVDLAVDSFFLLRLRCSGPRGRGVAPTHVSSFPHELALYPCCSSGLKIYPSG